MSFNSTVANPIPWWDALHMACADIPNSSMRVRRPMAGKPTAGDSRSRAGTEESRRFTRAATPCLAPPWTWCAGGDPTYEMTSIGGGRRSLPETARHERFQVVSYMQESRKLSPSRSNHSGNSRLMREIGRAVFSKSRPDQVLSLSRKGKGIWSNPWDFTSNDLRWQRKLA